MTIVGETPLSALGLVEEGHDPGPPGGTVYVTTEPISRAPTRQPLTRMWCVVYHPEPSAFGDGVTLSGVNGLVPDGWSPPDG